MKQTLLLFILLVSNLLSGADMPEEKNPKLIPVQTAQPAEERTYPVAIIGAGAAGTMAVKRAVLNNHEVLLFTGAKQEQKRSRGYWVRTIDNIPGMEKYTRTVLELRNEALEDLVSTPFKDNLYVIEDSIFNIEKQDNRFKLTDGQGRIFYAQYVILATGIMDEQPHIQGSITPILKPANKQTVAYCLVCDGHRSLGKKTAVIGYSEGAAQATLSLSEKYQLKELSILTNGHIPEFSEQTIKKLQERKVRIFEQPILEVLTNENKHLLGFKLENGEEVEVEMGFVSLGIRPNNQLALQLDAQVDDRGLVVANAQGESSVAGLFVAGDLRSNPGAIKQIYTAWQQAVESTQEITKRIRIKD